VTDISHRSTSVFSSIPYDLYCPSIQKVLSERIWKTCGQYFASIVMLRNHIKTHKHQPSQTKLVRPVRVAARQQREMMVIIANAENVKSAEWQDEDNLDISEMIIPDKSWSGSGMQVVEFSDSFIFCSRMFWLILQTSECFP